MMRVWELRHNTKLMRDGEAMGLYVDSKGALRRNDKKPTKSQKKAAKRMRLKLRDMANSAAEKVASGEIS